MTNSYTDYHKNLVKKIVIDDAWIKLDEKYICVKTHLLKAINFFDNLLTDILNFDMYDKKPIIMCVDKTQLPFITKRNLKILENYLWYMIVELTDCVQTTITVKQHEKYILFINYLCTGLNFV